MTLIPLAVRRSFYIYAFVLAVLNLVQMVGAILSLTETTVYSMWYVAGGNSLSNLDDEECSSCYSVDAHNELTPISFLFLPIYRYVQLRRESNFQETSSSQQSSRP